MEMLQMADSTQKIEQMEDRNTLDRKKVLIATITKLGIIPEKFTGEITIGLTDGGIKFIRRSETLK